jgi:type IV secretory pathway protease TraF
MRHRRLLVVIASVVAVAVLLTVLNLFSYWQINSESGTFSMAPSLPPAMATYSSRASPISSATRIAARSWCSAPAGRSAPKSFRPRTATTCRSTNAWSAFQATVVGKKQRVYVNGHPADNIPTAPFARVHLDHDQYFVMGDNRSVSEDSRTFGPVPRGAIYAKVILNVWPLNRVGVPRYNKNEKPPGPQCGQTSWYAGWSPSSPA